jgi:long-chain acyl-CoA synthetase
VLESSIAESRPWLRWYGKVPPNLDYPDITLYEAVKASAERAPDAIAWDFFDTTSTYADLVKSIDTCANALSALGLKSGDRMLIAMPTTPQGVIAFYAANKLGAIPSMVHPLSTAPEMENYLNMSGARIALTLDAFYDRFASIKPNVPLDTLILARIPEYLPRLKGFAFWLVKGRKIAKIPDDSRVRWWSTLMSGKYSPVERAQTKAADPAAILFSGGTTGAPKGILLSNQNFIAQGTQSLTWGGVGSGNSILAILPIFHGFGLGVCVNACFMAGGTSILVPLFSADLVAKLLRKKRPNIIVGVPTLFAALARDPSLAKADFSSLKATFSGADTLPRPVKEQFEKLVVQRGGNVKLMEGYGLTEAVTAVMAMPLETYREGTIGVPFPDMLAKICKLGTEEELPAGEEGEICLSGPDVMIGYLNEPEATRQTLRTHADGRIWLHTGDIGKMDADGFFYFVERLKRMIKSSGFNVFPGQVEAVLYKHPLVSQTCVIGVPDPSQVERVKAYVVLKDPTQAGPATEKTLIEYCQSQLIKWSCPREIEFRTDLPKTQIGKNDFKALVREHVVKHGGEAGV